MAPRKDALDVCKKGKFKKADLAHPGLSRASRAATVEWRDRLQCHGSDGGGVVCAASMSITAPTFNHYFRRAG